MKTIILALSLAVAGVSSAHAQLFQPAVTRDTILGTVTGALIGGHNHDRWGEGAVIGAAAGALFGATVDQPRTVVYRQPVVAVAPPTAVVYVEQPQPVQVVRVVAPAPVVYYAATPVVVTAPVRYVYVPRVRRW
ncbi:MAG TPA: YMGG-like glycine zipper-containing protein [Opitutaceae bacterium]|nr:YMGG-like glycine zipper-containing protein [Opitutaceae bacterium]